MKKTYLRVTRKDGSTARIAVQRVRGIRWSWQDLHVTVHGRSRTFSGSELESVALVDEAESLERVALDRAPALAERTPLSSQECQDIVVDSTPKGRPAFTGPLQQLMSLGVVNSSTQSVYKAGVMARVAARGLSIASNKIVAAPQNTVADSRDSVFQNAN